MKFVFKKAVVEEENAGIKPVPLLIRTKQQCAVWDNAIQVEIDAIGVMYLRVLYFLSILTKGLSVALQNKKKMHSYVIYYCFNEQNVIFHRKTSYICTEKPTRKSHMQ